MVMSMTTEPIQTKQAKSSTPVPLNTRSTPRWLCHHNPGHVSPTVHLHTEFERFSEVSEYSNKYLRCKEKPL